MKTLSQRLDEKVEKQMKRFQEHPIHQTLTDQPFGLAINHDTKLIFYRFAMAYLYTAADLKNLASQALQLTDSEAEKQFLVSIVEQMGYQSRQKFKEQFKSVFGEVPNEVKADSVLDLWTDQRTELKLILAEKDCLQFIVALYGVYQLFRPFLKSINDTVAEAFVTFQGFRSGESMNAIRQLIDSHPKVKSMDNKYYRRLEDTFARTIETEICWYNFYYGGNPYAIGAKLSDKVKLNKPLGTPVEETPVDLNDGLYQLGDDLGDGDGNNNLVRTAA